MCGSADGQPGTPQALQQLAEGCGRAFPAAATPELRRLMFRGLHHTQPLRCAMGYHTLAALCASAPPHMSWTPGVQRPPPACKTASARIGARCETGDAALRMKQHA